MNFVVTLLMATLEVARRGVQPLDRQGNERLTSHLGARPNYRCWFCGACWRSSVDELDGGRTMVLDNPEEFWRTGRGMLRDSPAVVYSTGRGMLRDSPAVVYSTGRGMLRDSSAMVYSTGRSGGRGSWSPGADGAVGRASTTYSRGVLRGLPVVVSGTGRSSALVNRASGGRGSWLERNSVSAEEHGGRRRQERRRQRRMENVRREETCWDDEAAAMEFRRCRFRRFVEERGSRWDESSGRLG